MHVCGTLMMRKPARGSNNSTSRNSSGSRGKWKKQKKRWRGREGRGTEREGWRGERGGEHKDLPSSLPWTLSRFTFTWRSEWRRAGLRQQTWHLEWRSTGQQRFDWSVGGASLRGSEGIHPGWIHSWTHLSFTWKRMSEWPRHSHFTIKVVKKTKVKLKKAQTYERKAPEIKQSLFLPEAAPRRCTHSNKVLIWRKITKTNPTSMSEVQEGWVK